MTTIKKTQLYTYAGVGGFVTTNVEIPGATAMVEKVLIEANPGYTLVKKNADGNYTQISHFARIVSPNEVEEWTAVLTKELEQS